MVDFIPVLLLVFGLISVIKPEWIVAVHRRQKAAGTTQHPENIEATDGVYVLIQAAGGFFLIFGLVFTLRSL